MQIDETTGEIVDKNTAAILPAIDTLRAFPDSMAKAAVALHDAMDAVRAYQKKATVTLTITIEPFKSKSNAPLIDEPVIMALEVDVKLPRADPPVQLFFYDEDGNPTREQRRQRDLGLGVKIG